MVFSMWTTLTAGWGHGVMTCFSVLVFLKSPFYVSGNASVRAFIGALDNIYEIHFKYIDEQDAGRRSCIFLLVSYVLARALYPLEI